MLKNTPNFSLSTKQLSWALAIGGLIFYFLLTFITGLIPQIKTEDPFLERSWIEFSRTLVEVLKLLSGVLISSGIISLLLELSTIKDNMLHTYKRLVNDILRADFQLDSYSYKVLDDFHIKIIAQKHTKVPIDQIPNSIYSLEKNLNDLIESRYLDSDEAVYWVTPDSERGVFQKKVRKQYTVINKYKQKNRIDFRLSMAFDEKIPEEEKLDKLKITAFKINTTDLTEKAKEYLSGYSLPLRSSNIYNYCLAFKMNLQECEKHTITLEYEYEVPISDFSQTQKNLLPCKKLSHQVYLIGKEQQEWSLQMNGFAPFYFMGSDLAGTFEVKQNTLYNVEFHFNQWTLPGAGYVVSFNKLIH